MFRNSNLPLEIAMTHRVGAGGATERCLRPESVREVVTRVTRWAVAAESCQSCHSLPAARLAGGLPLCGRCHQHRAERLGYAYGELRARVERADDPEPADQRLQGYAIRFNEKSVELFGFFEIIRPVAADRLESEKPDLRALWNHDSSETIGRVSAGTLRAAKRTRGVWVEIDPPRWAARHVESIARRDIQGMSFGFYALDDDWWLEDGVPHREVLDMEVTEVSPVSFPAYPTTSIKAVNAGERSELWRERETAERLRLAR